MDWKATDVEPNKKETVREIDLEDDATGPTEDFQLTVHRRVNGVWLGYDGDIDVEPPAKSEVPSPRGERPTWWPAAVDTLTVWCTWGGVVQEAERRLMQAGTTVSERALCRELNSMWHETGRKDGTPESIRKIRARVR